MLPGRRDGADAAEGEPGPQRTRVLGVPGPLARPHLKQDLRGLFSHTGQRAPLDWAKPAPKAQFLQGAHSPPGQLSIFRRWGLWTKMFRDVRQSVVSAVKLEAAQLHNKLPLQSTVGPPPSDSLQPRRQQGPSACPDG